MTRTDIEQEYFEWMYHLVTDGRYSRETSYRKLLTLLHDIEFRYMIPKDANRAEDGEDLRYRFAYLNYSHDSRDYIVDCLARPCSVLEMMIALSFRCEETMDDPMMGDRTGQWFWKMVANLGLGDMYDLRFDKEYSIDAIERFMDREFEPDGRGGLFRVRNSECNMRDVEIWVSMLWYLDSIT